MGRSLANFYASSINMLLLLFSYQVASTLCDLLGCSAPSFSVSHHLPETDQVHVQWISDIIQPSHPLSPSSPFAFSLSHHQGLSQCISCLHQVAKILNIQGWFPLELTGLISLKSKWLSRLYSGTTIWKHQFLGTQPSLWSNYHIHTWLLGNHSFDHMDVCQLSDVSAF